MIIKCYKSIYCPHKNQQWKASKANILHKNQLWTVESMTRLTFSTKNKSRKHHKLTSKGYHYNLATIINSGKHHKAIFTYKYQQWKASKNNIAKIINSEKHKDSNINPQESIEESIIHNSNTGFHINYRSTTCNINWIQRFLSWIFLWSYVLTCLCYCKLLTACIMLIGSSYN